VKDERALRFSLTTQEHFASFSSALDGELKHAEFMSAVDLDEPPDA